MGHFYGMHLALCLMRLALKSEPVYCPGGSLEWVHFSPITVFLWVWLERVLSWSKLQCTNGTGALTLLLILGMYTHCVLQPAMWPRQSTVSIRTVWLSMPTAKKEKAREALNKGHLFSVSASHFIAVDATIQTNVLIYSFWELLEKWMRAPGYLRCYSYMF